MKLDVVKEDMRRRKCDNKWYRKEGRHCEQRLIFLSKEKCRVPNLETKIYDDRDDKGQF